MAQKPSGMHAEDINAKLRKWFKSLVTLPRYMGKKLSSVSSRISHSGHSGFIKRKLPPLRVKPFARVGIGTSSIRTEHLLRPRVESPDA
jgi:hypothetical protein